MMQLATPRQLLPSMLPFDDSIVFKDSSFFKKFDALPSPAQVRAASTKSASYPIHQLVSFPSLNLIVKFGPNITIAEGQCLWAIRNLFGDQIPVPEVYGWCREGQSVFIYTQLVRGVTLKERWEALLPDEKSEICDQLGRMVANLRTLEQDPTDMFVGRRNAFC